MPYRITQCYLPTDRGDIPAFTPAAAGTRLSDHGGMQGRVDLVGLLHTETLPKTVTHQLQVERRTGKVRRLETDVRPLCHATDSKNQPEYSGSIFSRYTGHVSHNLLLHGDGISSAVTDEVAAWRSG